MLKILPLTVDEHLEAEDEVLRGLLDHVDTKAIRITPP
jgi:hypothetical protein